MKKTILILSTILLVTSCSNKYEKAIADFEQTDGPMKIDLGFKAKNVKEIKIITVADSLQIIQDKILPLIDSRMESNKKNLQEAIEKYTSDSLFYIKSAFGKDYINQNNEWNRGSIQSWEKRKNKEIARKNKFSNLYKNRDSKEKLLIIVECTYTINSIKYGGAKTEETNIYKISVDNNIVQGYYSDDLFDIEMEFDSEDMGLSNIPID